jgi:hypothetical protein
MLSRRRAGPGFSAMLNRSPVALCGRRKATDRVSLLACPKKILAARTAENIGVRDA